MQCEIWKLEPGSLVKFRSEHLGLILGETKSGINRVVVLMSDPKPPFITNIQIIPTLWVVEVVVAAKTK